MTLVAIPGIAALSHLAVTVLIFPNIYGDRLILPLYPLLIPYAAFAVGPVVEWLSAALSPRVAWMWLTFAPMARRRLISCAASATKWLGELAQHVAIARVWLRHHVFRIAPLLLATLAACLFLPPSSRFSTVISLALVLTAVTALAAGTRPRMEPRAWLYLGYGTALISGFVWQRADTGYRDLGEALLLPIAVFGVARLAQKGTAHPMTVACLLVGAWVKIAVAGSLSPEALHDPLFWCLLATVAAALSALARGWANGARAAATLVGVFTTTALFVPMLPTFTMKVVLESFSTLARAGGLPGALCLLGLWVQAIAASSCTRDVKSPRAMAACQGALLTALLLGLAGALPEVWQRDTGHAWEAFALLLGLAEARGAGGSFRIWRRAAPRSL